MKKYISLILTAVLALGVLAGCGKKEPQSVSTDGSTSMNIPATSAGTPLKS